MEKRGSIIIFVLLTFTLITTGGLFALYMASEQIEIANDAISKIQCQYLAESKINRLFYDKKYYEGQVLPSIKNHMNKFEDITYQLESKDLLYSDNNGRIKGRFYNQNNKRFIELKTVSEYKGIKTEMKAYGPVFNEIFYNKNPALSYNTIVDEEHFDKFTNFMEKIGDEILIKDFSDGIERMAFNNHENICLQKNGIKYDIKTKLYSNEEENIYATLGQEERIFMIIKSASSNRKTKLEIKDDINFRGIVYLEGDLVVSTPFNFTGIFIINGKDSRIIIDEELRENPRINGIILYDGELDEENWDLKYSMDAINRFGIYLPNFIVPELLVYKSI